jgi:DNA-binding response OmpR family regulator
MVITLRDKNITVLVVDHNPVRGEAIPSLLRGQGVQVLTAGTDTEALVILREANVHVMVADILLPRMTGPALIKEVRDELCLDIPIIVLTRTGSEEMRDLAMSLGADTFITKPVSPGIFLQQVETLISSRENKKEANSNTDKADCS